jgi:hypothetical protein
VLLGQLKQRNDWLVGYYYAHIETFAVNASYSTDDWSRFGNGAQAANSDHMVSAVSIADITGAKQNSPLLLFNPNRGVPPFACRG